MDEATKAEIVERLNEIIVDLIPDVTFRSMYGGTVIELKKDDPKTRVGGIFVYASYVSLEFANGISFDDPERILEGKGKSRRHVKLHDFEDVKKKDCRSFLKQAILLP